MMVVVVVVVVMMMMMMMIKKMMMVVVVIVVIDVVVVAVVVTPHHEELATRANVPKQTQVTRSQIQDYVSVTHRPAFSAVLFSVTYVVQRNLNSGSNSRTDTSSKLFVCRVMKQYHLALLYSNNSNNYSSSTTPRTNSYRTPTVPRHRPWHSGRPWPDRTRSRAAYVTSGQRNSSSRWFVCHVACTGT
ncbi:hypothetical protein ElyMa_005314000 [Elysia marginata]|uniref:Secreted protein n=1 Tax=Elysia marginata TaxID=1093978 RepID=A0AAV4JZP1_9GAST|nr:hypothetical protein ElyMa_005314000 [Elysia marginata]